jgi:hypothetical protein
MFEIKVVEKIKTHILCSIIIFFPFENLAVYDIMWKNVVERGRQATCGNMAHAHCMLDT